MVVLSIDWIIDSEKIQVFSAISSREEPLLLTQRNPVTRQKGIHANIDRSNAKANTPKHSNAIPVAMHVDHGT